MDNLQRKLQKKVEIIKGLFNTDKIISIKVNTRSIAKYYKVNKLAYTFFHSRDDFVHMGITRKGKYKKENLLEQPKLVDKYIKKQRASRLLELATGRGASSAWLAKNNPKISFYAQDLPDGQLEYAFQKAKKLKNFFPSFGDYHNLRNYPEDYFDIVFIFEALCHSKNKKKVIKEVKRVLKKNGIFIIIDAYLGKQLSSLSPTENLAKKLLERGMLVEKFEEYGRFKKILKSEHLNILYEEDASRLILPSVRRLERLAKVFFSIPKPISRMIINIFPAEFINNSLSGYLMPDLIELGIAKYVILVVSKN